MNYEESLHYLYNQLPYFSRIGAAAYKKDIGNTVALCDALGNPQHHFKSIHIAGTNGKGSTSHMLAAIFQENGYKTGLYTSPHLVDFRERIRINGTMISREFVTNFVNKMKDECTYIQPSFFELTVAMAFDYFAKEKVDIAIIETGLGGRLDSTNIIHPEMSIITNIGFDHMNLLGNTLEAIAFEKAGIIKNHTPVVIGNINETIRPVFDNKASSCDVVPIYADEMYKLIEVKKENEHITCLFKHQTTEQTETIRCDLNGEYQVENIRTVITAVELLSKGKFKLEKDKTIIALSKVKNLTGMMGRWDTLSQEPIVIADVAHNEDGIRKLLHQLQHDYTDRNLHFIIGFVADKDIDKILRLFPKNATYYFSQAHIPRALDANELKAQASGYELNGLVVDNVNDALTTAKQNANSEDVIMICGSFFLLAELNHYITLSRC